MTIDDISRDTAIEDLTDAYPRAVPFLMDHGIRCIRCGEPAWGTLGDAMHEKQFTAMRQDELVRLLRDHLRAGT
jgi:methionine synthase II (cobalamin-independent)